MLKQIVSTSRLSMYAGILTLPFCVGVNALHAATVDGDDGVSYLWETDGGDAPSTPILPPDLDITYFGGTGGLGGADVGNGPGQGGAGGDATVATPRTATAVAGNGGQAGPSDFTPVPGGRGGNADATAIGIGSVAAEATGGTGGGSSEGGPGGGPWGSTGSIGGLANASAAAVATSSTGATAVAKATGGNGGGACGGNGGLAAANASAQSDFGGYVQAVATQIGGNGHSGGFISDYDIGEAVGATAPGLSMDSTMSNQVGGYSQTLVGGPVGAVSLTQIAKAGNAPHGSGFSSPYTGLLTFDTAPGIAGNASSALVHISTHGEASYFAETEAWGGAGGHSVGTTMATPGGQASANATLQADPQASPNTSIKTQAEAVGSSGGNNTTVDDTSGSAGQGGSAQANAYSDAINGGAEAIATAIGGSGGSATVGENGVAGLGGNAAASAIAVTQTGTATVHAYADAGSGGGGGITGGALGGGASAVGTVKAGDLSISKYEVASDGGIAEVDLSLDAPVNGNATTPATLGGFIVDSSTPHTLTAAGGGSLTVNRPDAPAEIIVTGGYHTVASPIVFASDTTVTTPQATDWLAINSTTVPSGKTLTKAGAGGLLVLGDLDLSQSGIRLLMDATTITSPHAQIVVTGNLDIGETLDLDLVDGFAPAIGDSFDILQYLVTLTGTFDTVAFPVVDGLTFGIEYETDRISYHTVLEGDLNNDGFVGMDDLNLVFSHWNQSVNAGVLLLGDPTGDGFVGSGDQNIVLGNWNAGTPPTVGASVPEPATLGLFGALGFLLIRNRMR
jgi:hypothetical protein